MHSTYLSSTLRKSTRLVFWVTFLRLRAYRRLTIAELHCRMRLWRSVAHPSDYIVAAACNFFVAEFLACRLIEGIMGHLRDQLAALSATSPESIVEMLSGLEDRANAIIATSLVENFLGRAIAYKFGRFPSESEFKAGVRC